MPRSCESTAAPSPVVGPFAASTTMDAAIVSATSSSIDAAEGRGDGDVARRA